MIEPPEVKYARAQDGIHVAYQSFGVGRYDILYVPGQLSHLDMQWDDPAAAAWCRRLAQLGRVITMDRRGVGLSDRMSPNDLPPAEVLVEDLGVVLDAAGASQPVIFGFAEGGQIASLFAATHPDRVRGLILYGTWTHATEKDQTAYERYLEWATPRWGSPEHAMSDLRELLPSRVGDASYVRWVGRIQRAAISPGAIRALYEMEMALDVRDILPTITVPTLVMYREHDSYQPIEALRSVAALIPESRHVELPGSDHWITSEPQESMFDAIEAFLDELGGVTREPGRRLATVLFTDIVGSTELTASLGDDGWKQVVERHHATVRAALERYQGTEVDTAGDGFFATFDGPARAARCAKAIVDEVRQLGIEVRAGVHTGEVETINDKVGGIAVDIGARVAGLAAPGEVFATSTIKDLVAGSGLVFEDAGEHELKGVPDRWRLYRVVG